MLRESNFVFCTEFLLLMCGNLINNGELETVNFHYQMFSNVQYKVPLLTSPTFFLNRNKYSCCFLAAFSVSVKPVFNIFTHMMICWHLLTEARVTSSNKQFGICGGKDRTGISVFPRSTCSHLFRQPPQAHSFSN